MKKSAKPSVDSHSIVAEWRSNSKSDATEPNIWRTCSSVPQRIGGEAKSGGGGMYEALARKTSPTVPSGVEQQMAICAARAAHTCHLVRCALVAGSEHVAERGQDAVEGSVLERKLFGVALHPFDLDSGRRGLLAAAFEQLGHEVEAR